ncbi:MAG: hypothetical protein Q8P90_05850 [bacterium]|nr:hypothetical protein [bacterium]
MSKKHYFIIVFVVFATVIDISVLLPISLFAFTLSFGMINIISFSFALQFKQALIWGIIQGFFLDIFSPTIFGSYMIAALLLVIAVNFLRDTWVKQTSVLAISFISALSLMSVFGVLSIAHYGLFFLGIIGINPMSVVSVLSLSVGIFLQCIFINIIMSFFSAFQRFVFI